MSRQFKKVKTYFEREFWTIGMVRNAVIKGWITAEEY